MGCNTAACADCTRKCLLVHRKKTSFSPYIASFFKVMMGDQFSNVLFLPPTFAPTVSALIDKRTLLEDSNGQQWEVTISNLNGSLAFQQGWNAFSLHHKLEIGDFLVFDYVKGSHFFVRIYNKTACEKIDISENRKQRKRAKTTEKYTVAVKDNHKISAEPEPEIDQLILSPKESTSLSDGIPSAQLKFNGKCGKSNVPVAIETLNCHLGGSMNTVEEGTLGVAPELCTDEEPVKDIYGKLPQVMKADCGKSSDVRLREIEIPPTKTGTLDIVPISSPIAASISCVIASSGQSFLELPGCLPLVTSSTRRNKNGRKVVVLRDPDMRMWPVLYHEKSGFKILASGWEAFCKANNVQHGDKCIFGAENGTEGICGVNILRK